MEIACLEVSIVKNMATVSSPDEISISILKKIMPNIVDHLLKIRNSSLQNEIFPDTWKKSLIIPIPKVIIPKLPQETRPINLIPSYEKLIEIIVHKQLSSYLEENNLLYNQQFGFRKALSTETALQVIFSSWRNTLNQNKM
jgi:hypothetical protein